MQEENNAVSNFLNEVSEPRDIFKEEPETEDTTEEVVEEKALPFHRDPKVQKYVEKQVEKAMAAHKPSAEQQFRSETTGSSDVEDVIAAFTEVVGNDTPEKVRALKALEKTLQGSDERASRKAIEQFQLQQQEAIQQQAEAEEQAQEELDNYFDEIEDVYGVDLSSNTTSAKQMRSQFIDYVRKIAPKDASGEVSAFPDLVASFEVFQEQVKRAPATRAKEFANRGIARSGDTTTTVPQGRSWKDVDKFFDTLKKSN